MVQDLAKTSIETKIKFKSATLLGNYEFYYAAGIICKELMLKVEEVIHPRELFDFIMLQVAGKTFENETVTHLIKMIRYYIPDEEYDEQMKGLLLEGMRAAGGK